MYCQYIVEFASSASLSQLHTSLVESVDKQQVIHSISTQLLTATAVLLHVMFPFPRCYCTRVGRYRGNYRGYRVTLYCSARTMTVDSSCQHSAETRTKKTVDRAWLLWTFSGCPSEAPSFLFFSGCKLAYQRGPCSFSDQRQQSLATALFTRNLRRCLLEMPGNGFLHSHSLPFPCNRFPFLPIPIPNFVTNSHSHGIPIRLFPFLPIPIPEHYIDAA